MYSMWSAAKRRQQVLLLLWTQAVTSLAFALEPLEDHDEQQQQQENGRIGIDGQPRQSLVIHARKHTPACRGRSNHAIIRSAHTRQCVTLRGQRSVEYESATSKNLRLLSVPITGSCQVRQAPTMAFLCSAVQTG